MLRSSTFIVGILLAIGAFAALLLLGSVLNPPPYQVVIAVQDIPAYTKITSDMLAVDAQTMNSSVARGLVTRDEIDAYVGGLTLETIHAGETLRKVVIAAPNNPKANERLALALNDAEHVAMVIPVNPETSPEQIEAGDYVDIVLSLAPNTINANNQNNFGEVRATAVSQTPIVSRPTPTLDASGVLSATVLSPEEMNLPVAKVTIQKVHVLGVRRERIANPNFAIAPSVTEETHTTEPAFVKGDIQAVLVRVPRESVELLTFAMDNGKVHLSLLSPHLVNEPQDSPTLGMSWNDVIAWMMSERQRASGRIVQVASSPVTPTLAALVTATPTRVSSLTVDGQSATGAKNGTPAFKLPNLDSAAALLSNLACFAAPLGVGILLVIGSFFIIRRLKS